VEAELEPKWRSSSAAESQGETKRAQVLNFRKSLTNIKKNENTNLGEGGDPNDIKFRKTLRNSNRHFMRESLQRDRQYQSEKYSRE
jgi:hypothetical protein